MASTKGMDPLITWEQAMQIAQSLLDQTNGMNWEYHTATARMWMKFATELRLENERVDREAQRVRGQHQRPILTPTPTSRA